MAPATLMLGLSFNPTTGALSGTPLAGSQGTYNISFTAANGVTPDSVQPFTLTVVPALPAGTAPTITSASAISFTIGTPGSFTVTAIGNPTPNLSEVGTLPGGITFNPTTGALAGTPAAGTQGTYSIAFVASNGVLPDAVQPFGLTINAALPSGTAPSITSGAATTFTVGTAGTFTVTATGNPTPTLSETGALPAGVTFTPATGILSGTPAAGTQGTYSFTFTATNGILPNATQPFVLTVSPAGSASTAPAITSANSTTFTIGNPGSFPVTATGTPAPTLSEAGALPPGVTFNPATGTLSGTPGPTATGTYPITFTAANGVLPNASQLFTLNVVCNPLTKGCIPTAPTTVSPASLSEHFNFMGKGIPSMPVGTTIGLQFTITNFNGSNTLTGVGFTDTLPAGLVVAAGAPASCGGATVSAPAGGSSISLSGATLAPGASCGFTITVSATSPGTKTNTTSAVTSNEGGPGNTATDSILVVS